MVDANGDPTSLPGLFAFLVLAFSALGLVVLGWVRFIERRPFATIGLAGDGRAKSFLRGLAVGAAMSFAVVAAIWMAGGLEAGGYARAFGSPIALIQIGLLLPCFALQSSAEEIVFRGWLLSAIARKLNVPLAVVLTSGIFTFLHYSPHQHWLVILSSFLFSAFTCAWALKTDNIWAVMGWHSAWNWLIAIGFELPLTGMDVKMPALLVKLIPIGPAYLTGGAQGPEGSYLCSVILAAGSAFLISRVRMRSPSSSPPSGGASLPATPAR
ncbi:MAG: CPBP family intramembrane metalloprotease [Acidobacteria bacterium]|nr:CPBP family intramembrane metalloprotease [Acidobacteriota bacterium]